MMEEQPDENNLFIYVSVICWSILVTNIPATVEMLLQRSSCSRLTHFNQMCVQQSRGIKVGIIMGRCISLIPGDVMASCKEYNAK